MKEDLRNELIGKIEFSSLQKQVTELQDDSEDIKVDVDSNEKKIKENQERLDGHATRLAVDSDLITEL